LVHNSPKFEKFELPAFPPNLQIIIDPWIEMMKDLSSNNEWDCLYLSYAVCREFWSQHNNGDLANQEALAMNIFSQLANIMSQASLTLEEDLKTIYPPHDYNLQDVLDSFKTCFNLNSKEEKDLTLPLESWKVICHYKKDSTRIIGESLEYPIKIGLVGSIKNDIDSRVEFLKHLTKCMCPIGETKDDHPTGLKFVLGFNFLYYEFLLLDSDDFYCSPFRGLIYTEKDLILATPSFRFKRGIKRAFYLHQTTFSPGYHNIPNGMEKRIYYCIKNLLCS